MSNPGSHAGGQRSVSRTTSQQQATWPGCSPAGVFVLQRNRRTQVTGVDVNLVDAYIAKQPSDAQLVLRRVRRIIRKVLPDAEETISYQIPTYKLDGQHVVYFAGWKHHWSLYPVTDLVRAALGSELGACEVSKGTVRFRLADPVPAKLVERIVRELAGAAEGHSRVKASSMGKQGGRRSRTGSRG